MKHTILSAMTMSPALHDRLSALYDLQRLPGDAGPATIPGTARGARALITLGSLRTDAALMDALPELGLICCYGTGFEGVDRGAAAARGIVVTNAGDANATSVAEFAIGLMLTASRDILVGDRLVRDGGWTTLKLDRMPLVPGLAGRRLGIYGLGAIGLRIAQRAAAFEMEIGYHNRSPRPEVPYAFHGSLIDLARWADVLMVAVRAGADNRHAVDREILAALGRDGLLVNISRGIAVDEIALCDALEAGVIGGAALDVYEHEPQVPDRLKALPNVVLTPHMAALSSAAQGAQQQILIGNLAAFFAGGPTRWQVLAA